MARAKGNTKTIPVPFPFGGLNVASGFEGQPATEAGPTSPDLLNVRGFDPRTGRRRGASRSGLSKYVSTQINSTASIQCIDHVAGNYLPPLDASQTLTGGPTGAFREVSLAMAILVTDATSNAAYQMSTWDELGYGYVAWKNTSTDVLSIRKINSAGVQQWTISPFTFDTSGVILGMCCDLNVLYVLAYDVVGQTNNTVVLYRFDLTDGAATSSNPWLTQGGGLVARGAGGTVPYHELMAISQGAIMILGNSSGTSATQQILTSTGQMSQIITHSGSTTEHDIVSDRLGYFYVVMSDNATSYRIRKLSSTVQTQWTATGGTIRSVDYDPVGKRLFAVGNNVGGNGQSFSAVNASSGAFDTTTDFQPQSQATWHYVRSDGIGGAVVGIQNVGDDVLATVSASLADVGALTSSSLTITHLSVNKTVNTGVSATRSLRSIAVAGGTVKAFDTEAVSSVTNGTLALSPDADVIFSAAAGNGNLFFADGVSQKYYKGQTNEILTWTPTAGSLPTGDSGEKHSLIVNWRGRIVLSGFGDGNWYMSKLGDPFDWDYGATISLIMAVAGNNSDTGVVGDIINTMIPCSSDLLMWGCDHTIWQLTGDPANGGFNDLISDSIGMAWGMPWARDARGRTWFFGSRGGIFEYGGDGACGGQPKRMSHPIEEELAEINLATTLVRMAYDDRQQGVHVWLTPLDSTAATYHYFYDTRNNSWFRDQYADLDHNPKAVHVYDGDEPSDRAVLIGSWDGYIRKIDHEAVADDGTAINSHTVFGPINAATLDEYLLQDMHAVLGEESFPVKWEILQGSTCEKALTSVPVIQGTWTGGRNPLSLVRMAGAGQYLRLSSIHEWAIEHLVATIMGTGAVRARN